MSNLTDFFGSAVIQSEVFLVDGTWTPPLNINQCWVTGGGGGGGGGGGDWNSGSGGGGGGAAGSGGMCAYRIPYKVTSGVAVTVVVGIAAQGGAGAISSGTSAVAGQAGNLSSVGTLVFPGGNGGAAGVGSGVSLGGLSPGTSVSLWAAGGAGGAGDSTFPAELISGNCGPFLGGARGTEASTSSKGQASGGGGASMFGAGTNGANAIETDIAPSAGINAAANSCAGASGGGGAFPGSVHNGGEGGDGGSGYIMIEWIR